MHALLINRAMNMAYLARKHFLQMIYSFTGNYQGKMAGNVVFSAGGSRFQILFLIVYNAGT